MFLRFVFQEKNFTRDPLCKRCKPGHLGFSQRARAEDAIFSAHKNTGRLKDHSQGYGVLSFLKERAFFARKILLAHYAFLCCFGNFSAQGIQEPNAPRHQQRRAPSAERFRYAMHSAHDSNSIKNATGKLAIVAEPQHRNDGLPKHGHVLDQLLPCPAQKRLPPRTDQRIGIADTL